MAEVIPLNPDPATDNDPFADLKDRSRPLDEGDGGLAVESRPPPTSKPD